MIDNYKKHYTEYDLKAKNEIAGRISVFYTYDDAGQLKRKIEFIPYPSLLSVRGLNFFRDNHWNLLEENVVEDTDEVSKIKKINELIFTVVVENASNTSLLEVEKKRTAFDFEIPVNGKQLEFWLVHEFKDFFSLVDQPVKRVYQKGGYFVMGFDMNVEDSEIIAEVKIALQ